LKYKKHEMGSYNLHTIKTDKFKTIVVKIVFRRDVNKEELTLRNLLSDVMIRSTRKYNTSRLMQIEVEDLYGIDYNSSVAISGSYSMLSFDYTFLNDNYTEKGNAEKTFQFITDMIFSPDIISGKFNEDNFELSKNYLKEVIESTKENPSEYSIHRLLEEMDDKSPVSFRADGYVEDLDKITPKSLYEYYKSVISKDIVDIFIIGDIEDFKIKRLAEKYFVLNTFKKKSHAHFIEDNKIRLKIKNKTETENFNQSNLAIGANIINPTFFEKSYVSFVYNFVLGGGTESKLFREVRENNSLCYAISSSIYRLNNMMVITSGLSSENAKKAVSIIKKEVKNMTLGKFEKEDVMKAQINYVSSLKQIYDSPYGIINIYLCKDFLKFDLLDKKIMMIGKVTKKDVVKFAKKIKLNTIYLLEGENVDE
jgi:Predicted Zn-dependent peptidases